MGEDLSRSSGNKEAHDVGVHVGFLDIIVKLTDSLYVNHPPGKLKCSGNRRQAKVPVRENRPIDQSALALRK